MKIISVNVGLPREIEAGGRTVRTSIFKEPVAGPVRVGRLNLEGDQQSDLTVHGGADKAVYAYPAEHYGPWRGELQGVDLPWGAFGENLTLHGLLEDGAGIGDRFQAGCAEFVVTQPRMPCFKLALRLGRPDVVQRFLDSGRTGFYLSVAREGDVTAGAEVTWTARHAPALTVAEVVRLQQPGGVNRELLRRASEHPALPAGLRERFRRRLAGPEA
jgi:MOSC domain-containing protein YiiM